MCGIVFMAASRGGVGMGSGGGGRALTEMQRSKNVAKESCVVASASVADDTDTDTHHDTPQTPPQTLPHHTTPQTPPYHTTTAC